MEDNKMGIIESANLEYKMNASNTFLKTVSAFANYGDGDIIFGISDDGMIIGLNDLDILTKIYHGFLEKYFKSS